jgi:hypothetical protein
MRKLESRQCSTGIRLQSGDREVGGNPDEFKELLSEGPSAWIANVWMHTRCKPCRHLRLDLPREMRDFPVIRFLGRVPMSAVNWPRIIGYAKCLALWFSSGSDSSRKVAGECDALELEVQDMASRRREGNRRRSGSRLRHASQGRSVGRRGGSGVLGG